MLMSFFTIEILRRALAAQQRALHVTGHNVANVSTPGFTRQDAVLVTTPPSGGPSLQGTTLLLGTGVTVATVRQAHDASVDRQIRQQMATLAEWRVRRDLYAQIEGIFPEPSAEGLAALLGRFWNAWQELTLSPESMAARTALVEQAQTLAVGIRQTHGHLDRVIAQHDAHAVAHVERINHLATQIAALNTQIMRLELGGQRANDLRDTRGRLHGELATLVEVGAAETPNGELIVLLQGRQLVGPGGTVSRIQVASGGPGLSHTFAWPDGGALVPTPGALAASLAVRDAIVPSIQSRLAVVAASLIGAVNALHVTGYDLHAPPGTGTPFFAGSGSDDIAVQPEIASDPRRVAASATGEHGDARVALQIAQLRHARVVDSGAATVDEAYAGLVASIGVQAQEARRQVDIQERLSEQLSLRREATSGVSLDEEMANMIRFQKAYEAAARMVRAVDEMVETILTQLGA